MCKRRFRRGDPPRDNAWTACLCIPLAMFGMLMVLVASTLSSSSHTLLPHVRGCYTGVCNVTDCVGVVRRGGGYCLCEVLERGSISPLLSVYKKSSIDTFNCSKVVGIHPNCTLDSLVTSGVDADAQLLLGAGEYPSCKRRSVFLAVVGIGVVMVVACICTCACIGHDRYACTCKRSSCPYARSK